MYCSYGCSSALWGDCPSDGFAFGRRALGLLPIACFAAAQEVDEAFAAQGQTRIRQIAVQEGVARMAAARSAKQAQRVSILLGVLVFLAAICTVSLVVIRGFASE